ncbi:MAG: hypothetical protein H0W40_06140 [Methylibium sp.]|uniref:hypothetical protein n=1 Tax=Methylibium sp. TaxID=2067992 RepID=UPI0018222E05|nr:hypothetical protein [Methylibium sp.]MBA3596942.1 hypothetical protein [Methylibium sp.]
MLRAADPLHRRVLQWSAAATLWPLRSLLHRAAHPFGAAQAFRSPDRRLLEDVILQRYAASSRRLEVLFVGTRWYTSAYERLLAGHSYLTIDVDPRAARHGSTQGHVTACVSGAAACFAAGRFDVIVFNGVFGWGLDERTAVEAAVSGFHGLLREGGELVVGWNDVALRRPFALGELRALRAYERFAFEVDGPLVLEVPGPNRHRFEFFRKPVGRGQGECRDRAAVAAA